MDGMTQMAFAQADFAFDLLREINAANSNVSVVISPISVALALAMVYGGACGATAAQLTRVLARNDTAAPVDVHVHFARQMRRLNAKPCANCALETVNRAYLINGLTVRDEYKRLIGEYYGGQFESLACQACEKPINAFVANRTRGRITNLVDGGGFTSGLILINAIYLKAEWEQKFAKDETRLEKFFVAKDSYKEVEMMRMNGFDDYSEYTTDDTPWKTYFEDRSLQCLALPYSGREIVAYFVLPQGEESLDSVLGNMSAKRFFTEIVAKMHDKIVDIKIPKFRLESTHNLERPLRNMGVGSIFSGGLGGISESPLAVTLFEQKTFIETAEDGSEAAAATNVEMFIDAPLKANAAFHANRPFLFLLVDSQRNFLFAAVVR